MKVKKQILIVDDVTTNLKCLGEILRNKYSLSMAKSGEQALSMLTKVKPDLVLLDVKMPGMDGYETFEKIKEIRGFEDIPIIFLTADTENESELKGLRLGACDFIRKPYEPEVMVGRIERALFQDEKIRESKRAAMEDSLTGLWNRNYMQTQIDSLSPDTTGTFMIMDLDNFKGINDNYGHVVGDEALVSFAKTLSRFVHKDDIVARLGGDEFAVFLNNCYGREMLEERVASLIKEVEQELCIIKNDNSASSVSVGISAYPFDGKTFIELYNNADKALYYVKSNGKSGFHFYDASEKYSYLKANDEGAIDLSDLMGGIDEGDEEEGPFKVEYNSFKNIYRFLKRYVSRTSSKIQLILFTLKDLTMQKESDEGHLLKAMRTLEDCVRGTLRKNDVSARYTNNQYIVILIDADEKSRQIAVSRILDNWNETNHDQNILLKYDMEEMLSDKEERNE
ncbi:MAG: diguanylate cyclase [Lachnospiraceae bacterium]|nr:diguanylate cyclase [Lachnospiraceae bacterium]